jgi:hypothetical protein
MISPQERIADAVRYGQETMNSTVRTWSDGVQKLVSNIDLKSTIPTLDELVDRSYELGVQLLARQRDFTKSLLAHAEPLTETLSNAPKQAERFVMRTERTAAKKAEDAAAQAEDIAAGAERTATRAQHSASARTGRRPTTRK